MDTFGFDTGPQLPAFTPQPLLVELVPLTTWEVNLRSALTKRQWDQHRKAQYKRANYRCEICGERGTEQGYNYPVECHEVWQYDDVNHIQILVRLIALCPCCHRVKHAGRTITVDRKAGRIEVEDRLMKINGWSRNKAANHIKDALQLWEDRSHYGWQLNLDAIRSSPLPVEQDGDQVM